MYVIGNLCSILYTVAWIECCAKLILSVRIGQKAAFLTGEKSTFHGPSAGSHTDVTKGFLR